MICTSKFRAMIQVDGSSTTSSGMKILEFDSGVCLAIFCMYFFNIPPETNIDVVAVNGMLRMLDVFGMPWPSGRVPCFKECM